ncbi:unnamed protein product [Blepharisma stoltei]|uniref:Peptidase A1 domain-containing protein n=1 Tax=Blepharisma stoltei TaxID=1481888 RepID=A0AAU9K100_9CILI|nr:unnamed protein product [Blepharisma stoltei]
MISDYFIYFNDCSINSNVWQCNDKNIENYPSIKFILDNQYFEIPNTAYVKYNKETDTITLLLLPSNNSKWVLGSPFLRQFIAIFTQGIGIQSTIGLANIDIKPKNSSSSASNFWSDWSLYFYIGIGVAGCLIVVILLIILYRLKKRR